jgi:hypothetical protein
LTQYLPFEAVDDVLEETGTVQLRLRDLPSRVGVYFVVALGLFPGLGELPRVFRTSCYWVFQAAVWFPWYSSRTSCGVR